MDKTALIRQFRELLAERLAVAEAGVSGARDGARVDGSHRPANRGERAAVTSQGYLAHGLSQRIGELRLALRQVDEIDPQPRERVSPGALVRVEEDDGEPKHYLVLPGGQGDALGQVRVVSPQSPVARALIGCEPGDEASLVRAGNTVSLLVDEVW